MASYACRPWLFTSKERKKRVSFISLLNFASLKRNIKKEFVYLFVKRKKKKERENIVCFVLLLNFALLKQNI